ncbi:hypothetical protein S101267_01000 [Bacillus amyloliquefaciens]|nr:hypothetical protein S101267_01000 [Bacillus amyloliquefaciens]
MPNSLFQIRSSLDGFSLVTTLTSHHVKSAILSDDTEYLVHISISYYSCFMIVLGFEPSQGETIPSSSSRSMSVAALT